MRRFIPTIIAAIAVLGLFAGLGEAQSMRRPVHRNTFNPRTGNFAPSTTGGFVFAPRGDVVSAVNGNNVPVFHRHHHHFGFPNSFDPFGTFTPTNQPTAASSFYKFATNAGVDPYTAYFAANGYSPGMNPYIRWNTYANNPYAYNPYGYNPYTYASPYGGYGGGYGSSNYAPMPSYNSSAYSSPYTGGGGGYGSSANSETPYAYGDSATSNYAPSQGYGGIPAYTGGGAKAKPDPVMGAFGIPNVNGNVTWPLAFRLLPPNQKRDLLDKLEAQLKVIASQGVGGQANPIVLNDAKQTAANLKQWLTTRRYDLAGETYREAVTFLRNLDKTFTAMGS